MISIVIIAYNEKKEIASCLMAMSKQTYREPFEVIVVDNASTDHTPEIAQSFAERLPLRVIREEHKGRGAARARGFGEAKGEIILSTDGDTLSPPHWIETMVKALKENLAIVAVTGPCKIQDCDPLTNMLFNIIQPLSMHLYRLFVGHYWLTGSNFAIRREAYQTSGGFDPASASSEDTELSFKVKKIGKIRYVPCAVISSGRRFKGGFFGLLKGLFAYPWTWIKRFIFRKEVDLSDVR